MLRIMLFWLGLVPLMIGNGIVREFLYGPSMSELRAHQLSTVTGVAILMVYAWMVFPWLRLESAWDAWVVGGAWFGLTIAFEFGFGHFVAGHSWSRLLHDYDLSRGRVWSLFLLAVILAPWLVFRGRH